MPASVSRCIRIMAQTSRRWCSEPTWPYRLPNAPAVGRLWRRSSTSTQSRTGRPGFGALRQAIADEQLVLYYQPIVDARSHEVQGVEALVRWQHPQQGLIAPDRFILLAEETGLIRPLTRWVVEAALR